MAAKTDDLPTDLIDAAHAARVGGCHISTVHRWVLGGVLRGWWRRSGRRNVRARLHVSRAAVEALFEPVEVVQEEEPVSPAAKPKASTWAEDELRKRGMLPW